jgi:hypothetical protein
MIPNDILSKLQSVSSKLSSLLILNRELVLWSAIISQNDKWKYIESEFDFKQGLGQRMFETFCFLSYFDNVKDNIDWCFNKLKLSNQIFNIPETQLFVETINNVNESVAVILNKIDADSQEIWNFRDKFGIDPIEALKIFKPFLRVDIDSMDSLYNAFQEFFLEQSNSENRVISHFNALLSKDKQFQKAYFLYIILVSLAELSGEFIIKNRAYLQTNGFELDTVGGLLTLKGNSNKYKLRYDIESVVNIIYFHMNGTYFDVSRERIHLLFLSNNASEKIFWKGAYQYELKAFADLIAEKIVNNIEVPFYVNKFIDANFYSNDFKTCTKSLQSATKPKKYSKIYHLKLENNQICIAFNHIIKLDEI